MRTLKIRRIHKMLEGLKPFRVERWQADQITAEGPLCFEVLLDTLCQRRDDYSENYSDERLKEIAPIAEAVLLWLGEPAIFAALASGMDKHAIERCGCDPIARLLSEFGIKAIEPILNHLPSRSFPAGRSSAETDFTGGKPRLDINSASYSPLEALKRIGTPALRLTCDLAAKKEWIDFMLQVLNALKDSSNAKETLPNVLVEKLPYWLQKMGVTKTLSSLQALGAPAIPALIELFYFVDRNCEEEADWIRHCIISDLASLTCESESFGQLLLEHACDCNCESAAIVFQRFPRRLQSECIRTFNKRFRCWVLSSGQSRHLREMLTDDELWADLTIPNTAYVSLLVQIGEPEADLASDMKEQKYAAVLFSRKYRGVVYSNDVANRLVAWFQDGAIGGQIYNEQKGVVPVLEKHRKDLEALFQFFDQRGQKRGE